MFRFKWVGVIFLLYATAIVTAAIKEQRNGVVAIERLTDTPYNLYYGYCYDFTATLVRNGKEREGQLFQYSVRDQHNSRTFVTPRSSINFPWQFLYTGSGNLTVSAQTVTGNTKHTYKGRIGVDVMNRTFPGNISLVQRGVALHNIVNPKRFFSLSINVSADLLQDAKFVTTFWYENCTKLRHSGGTTHKHNFREVDRVYEVLVVVVLTIKGAAPRKSPYICDQDILLDDPIDFDKQIFRCSQKSGNETSYIIGMFRGKYMTRATKQLKNGAIVLRQSGEVRTHIVATHNPLTIDLQLYENAHKMMKQSKYVKTFWHLNCTHLDDHLNNTWQYTFTESNEMHEIVGIIVGSYENQPPQESPYICANNSFQREVAPRLTALFRINFKTRHLKYETGELLITQHDTTHTDIVGANEQLNMRMKVDETIVEEASSMKTFWYGNCVLLGKASSKDFSHKFMEANQQYNVVGVLVMVYEGGLPKESPYHCRNDSITENIRYAVRLYKSNFSTRAETFGGALALTQNGRIRRYYVANKQMFDLSVQLSENEKSGIQNSTTLTSFWYSNCTLLATTTGLAFRSRFNQSFEAFEIVCVLLNALNAQTSPVNPYNCANDSLAENKYSNYTVGVYRNMYYSLEPSLEDGSLSIKQQGNVREDMFATGVELSLRIHLGTQSKIVLKNSKSEVTFWYKNCSFIGKSFHLKFKTTFEEVNKYNEVVGALVSIVEGDDPTESPYNCSSDTVLENTNENYVVGIYRIQFETIDPIRITSVIGETEFRHEQSAHLNVSFTGSRPCQYCVLYFEAGYRLNGNEKCSQNETDCNGHNIEFTHKIYRSQVVIFIIANEVSQDVKNVTLTEIDNM